MSSAQSTVFTHHLRHYASPIPKVQTKYQTGAYGVGTQLSRTAIIMCDKTME